MTLTTLRPRAARPHAGQAPAVVSAPGAPSVWVRHLTRDASVVFRL